MKNSTTRMTNFSSCLILVLIFGVNFVMLIKNYHSEYWGDFLGEFILCAFVYILLHKSLKVIIYPYFHKAHERRKRFQFWFSFCSFFLASNVIIFVYLIFNTDNLDLRAWWFFGVLVWFVYSLITSILYSLTTVCLFRSKTYVMCWSAIISLTTFMSSYLKVGYYAAKITGVSWVANFESIIAFLGVLILYVGISLLLKQFFGCRASH